MRAAASTESFRAAPVGRYVRGDTWLFACANESLYATFLAGRPSETDLAKLASVYGVPLAAARPHAVLFDASRVEALDTPALDLLLRFFAKRAASYSRTITRVAVARGGGATGAVFAGYPKVIALSCPSQSFDDTEAALTWLGADAPARAALMGAASTLSSEDALTSRLRALLEEKPATALAEAARALGLSARSLQRELSDNHTTYRLESDRARMSIAARRLKASDASIGDIALDVGFASLQSFSDWFRAQAGESPSSYRAKSTEASTDVSRRGTSDGDARESRSAKTPSLSGTQSKSVGGKRTRARER
jgi:AraC-like DNA-binding protein